MLRGVFLYLFVQSLYAVEVQTYEGWWVVVKTLLALFVMCGLLFGLLYLVKRMQMSVPGLSKHMKIVGALVVGQKERLVLVEVQGEWLILGVTSQQIQVLHRIPKPDQVEQVDDQAGQSFLKILQQKMSPRS